VNREWRGLTSYLANCCCVRIFLALGNLPDLLDHGEGPEDAPLFEAVLGLVPLQVVFWGVDAEVGAVREALHVDVLLALQELHVHGFLR